MKLWHIAILIFVFNVTLNAMVDINTAYGLGFQETTAGVNSDNFISQESLNESEDRIRVVFERDQEGLVAEVSSFVESVKMALQGVYIFGQSVVGTAVFTEATVDNITGGYLPFEFVLIIGMVTRLIFIGGMVQLFLGRSFKDME